MNALVQYINSFISLSKEDEIIIEHYFKTEQIKKNDLIVKGNQVCKKLWFIKKGFARSFAVYNDGTERNTGFFLENEFMTVFSSYSLQSPSSTYLQALEDMDVFSITREDEQKLLERPVFAKFNSLLFKHYLIRVEQFKNAIRDKGGLEQYQYLLAKYPELIKRAKLKDIASLLGISPSTLSRIRAK